MSDIIIKFENVSKKYQLGVVGTGTLSHDLNRWWAKIRGKADPALRIGEENKLSKAGGDFVWALKDINLEVKRGDVLGIIGKNGAGKSTLLKILSRITGPTTGKIKVGGTMASLLEVGTGFHQELTGRENIFLNGAILGMTRNDVKSKLDEIIEFSGVQKFIDTPVKRYSSGMFVRLAFAVAAHLEPDILIVDEVLAVGDADFQKKAIGKMQDVSSKGGRTVLFVSHNMLSVEKLCKNAIIVKNGSISFESTAKKCIDKYRDLANLDNVNELKTDNRKGNGSIIITNVFFTNESNEKINSPICGDNINLNVEIEGKENFDFNKVTLDVGINDILGFRISWLNTDMVLLKNTRNNNQNIKRGTIVFEIKKIPLKPSRYSFNFLIKYYGIVTDWLQNCYYFDINEGDFYGTGKTIVEGQGSFLIDCFVKKNNTN